MATEDISVLLPVFITEFSLILMINAITIIAFARIRHLRKRSTYLIINLTVADLLVGAVAGPLVVFQRFRRNQYFPRPGFITRAVKLTFIIASPMNLSLISLDRLHAILFPFRHCLITKWSYFRIIIGSWFIALLFGSLMAGLNMNVSYSSFTYARTSFDVVNLLVLAVSYVVIFVNVRRPHSQNSAALQAERKLTTTLSIVTGVSVLTILPWAIYKSLPQHIKEKQTYMSSVDLHNTLAVISFANSIVNPFVYAIRMQEFRKAIRNLVSRQRQRRQTTTVQKRAHRLQPDTKLWTPTGKLQSREWKRRRGGKAYFSGDLNAFNWRLKALLIKLHIGCPLLIQQSGCWMRLSRGVIVKKN